MATNLRMSPAAVAALREASLRTGRSQQELLREAIDTYLGIGARSSARDRAVAAGVVRAPTPFVDVEPTVVLSAGISALDLLDRDAEHR